MLMCSCTISIHVSTHPHLLILFNHDLFWPHQWIVFNWAIPFLYSIFNCLLLHVFHLSYSSSIFFLRLKFSFMFYVQWLLCILDMSVLILYFPLCFMCNDFFAHWRCLFWYCRHFLILYTRLFVAHISLFCYLQFLLFTTLYWPGGFQFIHSISPSPHTMLLVRLLEIVYLYVFKWRALWSPYCLYFLLFLYEHGSQCADVECTYSFVCSYIWQKIVTYQANSMMPNHYIEVTGTQ